MHRTSNPEPGKSTPPDPAARPAPPTRFTVRTDGRGYDLSADVILIGDDILVAIHGGEKPHIGAVAAAQARPSLADPGGMSSSTSVICYVGHKEDDLVRKAAGRLAAALGHNAVVTAGVHWDHLSQDGIRQIMRNGDAIVDSILECVRTGQEDQSMQQ